MRITMRIEVKYGNVEGALRKLKKKMFDAGTIKDLMERRYHEKPSDKKRRKKKEVINRLRKQTLKEQAKRESIMRSRHRSR